MYIFLFDNTNVPFANREITVQLPLPASIYPIVKLKYYPLMPL